MSYIDHSKTFEGTEGEQIELAFNYNQEVSDSKDIYLCVTEYGTESVGAGISPEQARQLRDHLNFLLGE